MFGTKSILRPRRALHVTMTTLPPPYITQCPPCSQWALTFRCQSVLGSERCGERERERDGGRERSSHSPETTNTNRSLNRKHNLKETEAARIEPWPQVTAMSAPGFVSFPPRMTKSRCSSSQGMMSQHSGGEEEVRGLRTAKKKEDVNGAKNWHTCDHVSCWMVPAGPATQPPSFCRSQTPPYVLCSPTGALQRGSMCRQQVYSSRRIETEPGRQWGGPVNRNELKGKYVEF